ncbi:MAG: PEP-CTERM sorting domain-containing protein [Akkermansia sp.]|nr:PEP-CTERM sorting domain-containing protein [Akkermansia sp.]
MKKTLVALFALAGTFVSDGATTLRYLIEFNTGNGGVTNSVESTSAGATSITQTGYVNWNNETTMDGSSYVHPLTSSNWKIDDTNGIDNGNGEALNASDGFTIMFNGYATSQNWGDFVSFTVGTQSYKLEINNSDGLNVYNATQQNSYDAQLTNIDRLTWYNYGVSVYDGTCTLVAIDSAGTVIDETSFSGLSGNLTNITDIASFEMHSGKGYFTDNIAVYDGAIDTDTMVAITKAQVAGKGTLAVVPEPATASLSLLGLAALMIRRRRA